MNQPGVNNNHALRGNSAGAVDTKTFYGNNYVVQVPNTTTNLVKDNSNSNLI
jgi:hypothetical protein